MTITWKNVSQPNQADAARFSALGSGQMRSGMEDLFAGLNGISSTMEASKYRNIEESIDERLTGLRDTQLGYISELEKNATALQNHAAVNDLNLSTGVATFRTAKELMDNMTEGTEAEKLSKASAMLQDAQNRYAGLQGITSQIKSKDALTKEISKLYRNDDRLSVQERDAKAKADLSLFLPSSKGPNEAQLAADKLRLENEAAHFAANQAIEYEIAEKQHNHKYAPLKATIEGLKGLNTNFDILKRVIPGLNVDENGNIKGISKGAYEAASNGINKVRRQIAKDIASKSEKDPNLQNRYTQSGKQVPNWMLAIAIDTLGVDQELLSLIDSPDFQTGNGQVYDTLLAKVTSLMDAEGEMRDSEMDLLDYKKSQELDAKLNKGKNIDDQTRAMVKSTSGSFDPYTFSKNLQQVNFNFQ